MARPRKESGFTLVHSEGDDYYENRAALEGVLKSANKAARVFAGKAIPWQAATETVVTIGEPKARKARAKKATPAASTPRKGLHVVTHTDGCAFTLDQRAKCNCGAKPEPIAK